MKVYVDFEELDVEDKPTYICNKYNLQVKSINSGSIYENVKLVSLSDYTKQVRKEVCEEIKSAIKEKLTYPDNRVDCPFDNGYPDEDTICSVLDQIQGGR